MTPNHRPCLPPVITITTHEEGAHIFSHTFDHGAAFFSLIVPTPFCPTPTHQGTVLSYHSCGAGPGLLSMRCLCISVPHFFALNEYFFPPRSQALSTPPVRRPGFGSDRSAPGGGVGVASPGRPCGPPQCFAPSSSHRILISGLLTLSGSST